MNAPDQQASSNASAPSQEVAQHLAFSRKLQNVTNKIHATSDIDEIMLEVSMDICSLLEADRITLYVVSEDKKAIVSKIKSGLAAFKEIRLPIGPQSIAGFCALSRTTLNIADVYDDAELKKFNPHLRFLKEVDQRTAYRSRQMLVAPVMDGKNEVIGVIQLINTLNALPFSQVAVEGIAEIAKTLAIAFSQRKPRSPWLSGQYGHLVSNNLLSSEALSEAHTTARETGRDLEDVLLDDFGLTTAQLGKTLASFFGVEYEPFRPDRIKPTDLLKNIPRAFVQEKHWMPLEDTSNGLIILTPNPEEVKGSHSATQIFPKSKLVFKVCTEREFFDTVNQIYGEETDQSSIGDLLSNMEESSEEGESAADEISAAADNELVKLVNKIIVDAYKQKASDIHIEPFPGKEKTLVRFRLDGSLVPYIDLPASLRNALVARIKIMSDLDISEKRKPQDGKIRFKKFGPLDIELRVATLPTSGGMEDVVMRILAAGEPIPIDKLALSEANLKHTKELVSKPYGLFLVCGPTGSGKTTTLHSVLGFINTPDTKIWTAEDPVEITQKGLRQVQVIPKAGLTFAVAMRAFLRADPDVIMVGEMRDKETVSMGVEASLTGHLVFSTLHTNSAPESVIRLLDMGMDPFNFADALLGILAQRLAKRLCSQCKRPHEATHEELEGILSEYCEELLHTPAWSKDPASARQQMRDELIQRFGQGGKIMLHEPVGCETCNNTGYKGRVGLHELLIGSDRVKKLIQEHARVAELLAGALEEGMRTLKQDGIEKVLQGITDMRQVRSVCIK